MTSLFRYLKNEGIVNNNPFLNVTFEDFSGDTHLSKDLKIMGMLSNSGTYQNNSVPFSNPIEDKSATSLFQTAGVNPNTYRQLNYPTHTKSYGIFINQEGIELFEKNQWLSFSVQTQHGYILELMEYFHGRVVLEVFANQRFLYFVATSAL